MIDWDKINKWDEGLVRERRALLAALPSGDTTDQREIRFLRFAAEEATRALFEVHHNLGGQKSPEEERVTSCWAWEDARGTLFELQQRIVDLDSSTEITHRAPDEEHPSSILDGTMTAQTPAKDAPPS